MANLVIQVHRHIESLKFLQVEIEQLYEAVGIKTGEAREKLLAYRDLKRQAENALDVVSEDYGQALDLFKQTDALLQKLSEIKAEHIVLSKRAIKQEELSAVIKLKQARKKLRGLHGAIEKLKAEGLPSTSQAAQSILSGN